MPDRRYPFDSQTTSELRSAKSYALVTVRGPQNCPETRHHPRPRAATRAGRPGVQSDYGPSKNLGIETPNSYPRNGGRRREIGAGEVPDENRHFSAAGAAADVGGGLGRDAEAEPYMFKVNDGVEFR
ncbi:hypothetical protein L3X38_021588 [Prunus dulcis]|uniref:Uncharacterized protein n=1 Tax=Prunus dulcis TaxID=3755 RepID=A0AAD4Z2Q5_PRUDU|nr:hypothetical protein L3X38_021588 [Prunus dulcis]